tara:strand:+ start:2693 stop:3070 length:378 start_codon:yes stop_codon:yes gene_type:complete
MKILIIDAANDKIFFKIIINNKSYTSDYLNSRENFDKFSVLLFSFLDKNNVIIRDIDNVFINQGPGKFSGIRISIASVKALKLANNFDLYGFNSKDVIKNNYENIIELFKKGALIKNLIKPQYLS